MKLIISEILNPSLSKVVSLLYADRGAKTPQAGHWIVPASCAPNLKELEAAAAALSTELPAQEDSESAKALGRGEAPRYLDCEMASLVLGPDELSRAIASRIPHGPLLLEFVCCVVDFLEEEQNA